jgi:hypothetical protein
MRDNTYPNPEHKTPQLCEERFIENNRRNLKMWLHFFTRLQQKKKLGKMTYYLCVPFCQHPQNFMSRSICLAGDCSHFCPNLIDKMMNIT